MARIRAIPVADAGALADAKADVLAARREWERYQFARVTVQELDARRDELDELRRRVLALRRSRSPIRDAIRTVAMTVAHRAQRLMGIEDRHAWAVPIVFGVAAVVAVVPVVFLTRPPPARGVVAILGSFVTAVLIGAAIVFPVLTAGLGPAIARIRAARENRERELAVLRRRGRELFEAYRRIARVRVAQARYENAVARHAELESLLASERHQLRTTNWRSLRGVPFEQFLARVFRMLGYAVETTKGSGDQGIDLVVVGKGRRIAVQSKGYGGSVGNKAVQEVYAGMRYYRCTECVVITNSQFTSGAVELARAVGCQLVDGRQMADLIDGRLF